MTVYNTTIYAYSSDDVYCDYTLGMSKNGNTTTVWVDGLLHGSTESRDKSNKLYAYLHYNVEPDNSNGYATTYVSNYGTSFGKGVLIFERLNGTDIPPQGARFYATWTIPNDETTTYKNCALFLSKSPDKVETNNNEAYLFIGKKLNNGHTTNKLRYYTEDLVAYTKCSAPTSVTASAGFVKPGDKITISWSGAEAGLNNTIRKYRVYYNVGKVPTTGLQGYVGYKDSENSTSTSVDIIMPDVRGNEYYFKVQTIGWAIGYNSDLSEAVATCLINQLPPAPTVIPEKTMIPSGGGSIVFSLTATDPDSQTTSFYYSTAPGGEKTEISNGGTIEVKDETTYYFYTFDGLEYSESYTSQLIRVNTKPTITSITTTGIGTLYTSDLLTNNSYKDSFYTQVSSTLELSKTAHNITWYARYATIPNSGSVSDWETTINLGNNNNLNANLDLSSNTNFKKLDNIVYQIGASYNDGIEDSDISWGDTNFVIAPVPTIGDFINQYGKTNMAYSTSNHFYHEASIIATKDSSVTSIDATINGATVTTPRDIIRGYLNDGYFKINIEGTNKNTEYTLDFTINRVIGSVTKKFAIYSAGLPYKSSGGVFSELDIFSQTAPLKAYSDTGNFTISLYNFFETTDYAHVNKNYNGNPTPSNCLLFTLVKGSKSLDIVPTYRDDSSTSNLYFNYNKNFYKTELLDGRNPLELDLETVNSVDLKITFKDVFGQSYSITKSDYLKLDFREPFINEYGFSISVLRNNNEVIGNIQEGDEVKFTLNWESYNSQVATIESYIYRSSTIIDNPSNITSWERYQDNSNYIWNINTSEVIPTGLIRSGTGKKIYTVGQLNKSNYVYFKISTTINGQSKNYYTDSYRITQRHVSVSKAGFSSFNYNSDEQKISYVHTSYDSGGGNTPNNINNTSGGIEKLEIGIQYSTDFNSESSEKKYISSTGEGSDNFVALITRSSNSEITDEESSIIEYTHSFNTGNFSYYNIRLVFKTTIGSIVKIGYGEETTIYNITPTIAYRKNQLGINTIPENFEGNDGLGESIKDTSILIIQSATNRNNIYFITPNYRIKFNINNGKIDGILLDAGNWNKPEPYAVAIENSDGTEDFHVIKKEQ